MKLVFDEESGTWGEAPEVYGVINCPTKEDYEYVLNAIKAHKQLEDKHWNECRQIAHYEDELRKAKELLKAAVEDIGNMSRYCLGICCDSCPHIRTMDRGCQSCIWQHEAEALALIGEDINVPVREDGDVK